MYFTIYRDSQNQYRWNLKGDNHEPVASGESYLQKAGVSHAVSLVNGVNGYRVDDHTESQGLLSALLGVHTPSPAFGFGLPNPSSTWPATLRGINPQASGLDGLLNPDKQKNKE